MHLYLVVLPILSPVCFVVAKSILEKPFGSLNLTTDRPLDVVLFDDEKPILRSLAFVFGTLSPNVFCQVNFLLSLLAPSLSGGVMSPAVLFEVNMNISLQGITLASSSRPLDLVHFDCEFDIGMHTMITGDSQHIAFPSSSWGVVFNTGGNFNEYEWFVATVLYAEGTFRLPFNHFMPYRCAQAHHAIRVNLINVQLSKWYPSGIEKTVHDVAYEDEVVAVAHGDEAEVTAAVYQRLFAVVRDSLTKQFILGKLQGDASQPCPTSYLPIFKEIDYSSWQTQNEWACEKGDEPLEYPNLNQPCQIGYRCPDVTRFKVAKLYHTSVHLELDCSPFEDAADDADSFSTRWQWLWEFDIGRGWKRAPSANRKITVTTSGIYRCLSPSKHRIVAEYRVVRSQHYIIEAAVVGDEGEDLNSDMRHVVALNMYKPTQLTLRYQFSRAGFVWRKFPRVDISLAADLTEPRLDFNEIATFNTVAGSERAMLVNIWFTGDAAFKLTRSAYQSNRVRIEVGLTVEPAREMPVRLIHTDIWATT